MSYFNRRNTNNIYSYEENDLQYMNKGYHNPYRKHRSRTNNTQATQQIRDYGPYAFAVNIENVTKNNNTFRTALWTGEHMQLTLMSIPPGEDIGLEMHENVDQFLRIEDGRAVIMMGDNKDTPNFQQTVTDDYAIIIPAGKWHNLINIGSTPLKLYSIYAPANHPFGTIHQTKENAHQAEGH